MGILSSLFVMAVIIGLVFYVLSHAVTNRFFRALLGTVAYFGFTVAVLILLLEASIVTWIALLVAS